MNALNSFLQAVLVFAVFAYFIGFVAPPPLRWRLWRFSVAGVSFVFLLAAVVVEIRAHPVAATLLLFSASLAAYGVLQVRREHRERAHRRPAPTPFLNLRVTGKTAVDLEDAHPFADEEEHE
ncbi:MAG TPA: hypothetical protein VGJ81_05510 [Thermoanaerobaculia bacterium]|jgi:hypothetical protein